MQSFQKDYNNKKDFFRLYESEIGESTVDLLVQFGYKFGY